MGATEPFLDGCSAAFLFLLFLARICFWQNGTMVPQKMKKIEVPPKLAKTNATLLFQDLTLITLPARKMVATTAAARLLRHL